MWIRCSPDVRLLGFVGEPLHSNRIEGMGVVTQQGLFGCSFFSGGIFAFGDQLFSTFTFIKTSGNCAPSSSIMFRFNGLAVISMDVGSKPLS